MDKRDALQQLADLKISKKEKRAWQAAGLSLLFIIVWAVLNFA